MPANTSNIPGTTVLSSLSLLGSLSVSSLSLGGGALVSKIGSGTVSIVAMTVLANRSLSTTAAFSGVTLGDVVSINPPSSGYSNGIVVQAYVSAADVLTINFSNVSGATAVQAAAAYPVSYIRF